MAENNENFEKLISEIESEDEQIRDTEVKEVVEQTSSSLTYTHEDILKEEGLTKDDMPADIRKMIITFERKMRMAKAKNAPEETMLKIQNLSTLIGDKIIDYLEADDKRYESLVKKEDGGGLDEGEDVEISDDSIIEDEDTNVEDDLEDELEDDSEEAERGGMFEGVLGGIFNW